MSFARTVVDNRYAVGALTLAAAIFGVLAYLTLPMQLFPDTAPPLINVVTMYPGASAEDVAQNLSRPLEEEFARLEGVNKVKSSSQDNLSLVTVEFNYTEDVNLAAVDAQNALARIRGDLPGDIREPQVLKFSTSDRPIITVGVRSVPMTLAREAAEDVLVPRLQRISGVAGVDVFGGAQRSVLVEVDLAKARAFAVPLARVVEAIAGQNVSSPAGSYRTETTRTTFRIEAEATRLEALSAMVLTTSDGVPLRLGDIATISDGALESDATFGIDGKRAIAMQVFRAEDANTVAVVNGVLAEVERLRRDYPDLEFLIGEESATFTEQSISNLLSNVWQALLLASLLIFLFIGRVKASFVAVVSMPLSYGMTFALMKVSGTEFNMVTLTAVILAVGMVVDASVVVLENIIRKMDEGLSPEQAAVEGTDEVFLAVLAGAATTMAVLVPLLFLSGFIGKTFGPLALTLLYAFLSSVVVALVLVPVLSLYTGASRLDAVAVRVAMPFNRVMDGVQAAYGALLNWALRFRWLTMVVGFLMLVAGGGLMATRGMEVLPKMDGGSFFVSFQTAPGSSVEATTAAVAAIEKILAGEPEIVKVQSQAGFEQGMKISATSGAQGPTQGFITATLTPRTERVESIWSIEARVRQAVARVPGIESFTVRELGNSAKATTSAPILVRVSGLDPLILDRLGDEVLAALGEVPDVVQPVRNWEIDQERMQVDVDTLRAAELGLSPALVARQLIMGSDGVEAGSLRGVFGESTPIRVRYARAAEMEASDLLDYPVVAKSATGPTTVPMRAVATVTPVVGQSVVTREAYVPNIEVSAFAGDIPLSKTLNVVKARMAKLELPRGYTLEVAGESNDLAEARGSLLWALGIAVVAVYLLLVAQLKSWLHPVTIMMSVPLSLIGVGLALKLGGKPISMPVMVGLILLVGIVVNNAIILIEFIRQARHAGTPRRQALMDSVAIRFRPIMMTSLSTIVGMVPLAAEWALGAERFSPLALAVLGGMITATFLTLVMIPVLYDVLDDVSVKVGRLFGRSAAVALVLLVVPMNLWAAEPEVAMSLAEAERLAVRTSHSLQAQTEEVVAMEESADQALARRLPKLEVQAAYTRLSEVEPGKLTLPMALPGQEPTTMQLGEMITDVYRLRVSASQPIFTGFGLSSAQAAAEQGHALALERRELASKDVVLEVRETYYRALAARELLAVAEASVAALEAMEARITALMEAGRAHRADVSQVVSRVATARAQREKARGQFELLKLRLKVLTGVSTNQELVLTETFAGVSPGTEVSFEQALVERGELKLARMKAGLAQTQVDAASRGLWPQVVLQGGYTLANPNERYFPAHAEFNDSWDVSVVMSWVVWDFGVNLGERRVAQARARAAEHEVEHLQRMTELAVEQTALELENADREIVAAAESVTAARQAFEVIQRRFEEGRATATDVLTAELDVTRAAAEVVQLEAARQVALARLKRLGALAD